MRPRSQGGIAAIPGTASSARDDARAPRDGSVRPRDARSRAPPPRRVRRHARRRPSGDSRSARRPPREFQRRLRCASSSAGGSALARHLRQQIETVAVTAQLAGAPAHTRLRRPCGCTAISFTIRAEHRARTGAFRACRSTSGASTLRCRSGRQPKQPGHRQGVLRLLDERA